MWGDFFSPSSNERKDKMKEDVIANLSDKLIMLSERLDTLEKLNR